MFKRHDARAYRLKRKRRVRARIHGTPTRQRLSVFRSSKHIYAQVIDDDRGHTLAAASSRDPELRAAALPEPRDGETAVIRMVGENATKPRVRIPVRGSTIPHAIECRFNGAKVMLKPAGPGTGIIAGEPVRYVMEAAGVHDILTKEYGSTNRINV